MQIPSNSPPQLNTITVFGSSLISIEPDIASLRFSVVKNHEKPQMALKQAQVFARQIHKYLAELQIDDVASSNLSIYTSHYKNSKSFQASVNFHVMLRKLDILEETLLGLVDVGIDQMRSIGFESSKTDELHIETRRRAIENAQSKARVFADSAGVTLGKIVSIEELQEQRRNDMYPLYGSVHLAEEMEESPSPIINPGNVNISAQIRVIFAIES